MNYPNQLLLIEEYKYALNKNQHQAIIIENKLLKEGLLDSSMEFIFTFGPLILDSIGGLIALTGVGIPLAGGVATASRGISIGGVAYFSYKLLKAIEDNSLKDTIFSSLGLLFSAASAGVPGAGSLVGALSKGVVRSLEGVFAGAKGYLKIVQASLDVAKNSKVYEGIGKAVMESKVIDALTKIYSPKLMSSTIELLRGLATNLAGVTTTGFSMIAKKLNTVIESVIPKLSASAESINKFFKTINYSKSAGMGATETGVAIHASLARSIGSVSDETASMMSKHAENLELAIFTTSDSVQKLALAGAVKSEINESLYLDELIWESTLKSKIIKAQKMIDLI